MAYSLDDLSIFSLFVQLPIP